MPPFVMSVVDELRTRRSARSSTSGRPDRSAASERSQGEHIKVVSDVLGHESISTTYDTYGHLYDEDLDAVADRLDNTYRVARADFVRTDQLVFEAV